jgi:hypothetical protein
VGNRRIALHQHPIHVAIRMGGKVLRKAGLQKEALAER